MTTIAATEIVTAFNVRVGDGPTVTAQRQGTTWVFGWSGKGDDRTSLECDYDQARLLAAGLAQKLADLEPARQEWERKRRSLSVWLKTQVRGKEADE